MASQVTLRSKENILGDLIRSILANTDLNDVAPGSDLATILEAIATSQFQISLGSLKILENSNLESLVGNALDQKAESMRLPNTQGGIGRIPASQSSGGVTIGSGFVKQSTKFYAGKPAPFAGSKTLYVESASSFPSTGRIYVGRGTADRFEGPILYTSTLNQGSFWVITLSSPLTKNHLYSDLLVLAQGGDRSVSGGTITQTSASNEVPSVAFSLTSSVVLPDGEAEIDASVTCTQFGEAGNALAGAIREFTSSPFPSATVTNKTAFQNGRSTESDEDLRKRIKNYPATLSRGTKAAIQSAIQGISDPDTGRTITSSVVIEPTEPGDYSRVYIDDGSGLEPTFAVQPYELLLQSASGQETLFQTAQFPITPCTAIGSEVGPFILQSGQSFSIIVDGVSETYSVTAKNYANLNAATAYEIVRDFNSQSNIVGFRTINGGTGIAMIDLSGTSETLRVLAGDLQKILGLPTAIIRPVFVYQNSAIKSFKGNTATLVTNAYPWNLLSTDVFSVPVTVDGVTQNITISNADFAQFSSDIASATLSQWATVFGQKIAGVSVSVAGNVLIWMTRQALSPSGTLRIPETRADGSAAGWVSDSKMWKPTSNGGILSSSGSEKDFKFNRFTGEIRFTKKPDPGTTIEIGSRNTRAYIMSTSTPTGLYTLSPFTGTIGNARMVVGFDGDFSIRTVGISTGDLFVPTVQDATNAPNVIRLFANSKFIFRNAQVGDYMYLIKNALVTPSWGSNIEGIYRLKTVGNNFAATAVNFFTPTAHVTNGSNIVTVTLTDHGFKSGARITITTSVAIGGIAAIDLSQPLVPITVIDNNTFTYVAAASATSTSIGILDQFTYDADSWIEFEVSQPQLADWTPLLGLNQSATTNAVQLFKSDKAIPQLIDFGAIGTVTVDAVVSIINSQISCGNAIKVNGQTFAMRSNDWANGSVAVLCVVAAAASLFLPASANSQQSHTAYSTSGYTQGGFPVVSQVVNQSPTYPTQAYLTVDKDLINIATTGPEPIIQSPVSVVQYPEGFESVWLTGRQSGLTGRVYNNQNSSPFTGILRTDKSISPLETSDTYQTLSGTLDRYANFAMRLKDLHLAAQDKLVVVMDLDSIDKTVAVPLFKKATILDIDAITGSGKGQVISFRLKDPEDGNLSFFDNTSIYKSYDFRDFKILTKAVGLYREISGFDSAASGYLTALPADVLVGVQDADTFTLNDGVNPAVVFEFDSDAIVVPGHIAIPFVNGAAAIGSLIAIAMNPGVSLSEGDTITLSDGFHAPIVFEFDSNNVILAGHTSIPFVHAVKATGSLTAFAAEPSTGIKDADTFTINDGATTKIFEFDCPAFGTLTAFFANPLTGVADGDAFIVSDGTLTKTFEFDTNASVIGAHIPVTIGTTDGSTLVKNAIIGALAVSGLSITVSSGPGNLIYLSNNSHGVIGNAAITEVFANAGVTLSPTGMSGGGVTVGHVPVLISRNFGTANVRSSIISAINGAGFNIIATVGLGDNIDLMNSQWGVAGNQVITESFFNVGVTLFPAGMTGGVNNATAATIKTAIILAINTFGTNLAITASSGAGNLINLINNKNGVFGNVAITDSVASGASLTLVGMAGGVNDPVALIMKAAMIAAINSAPLLAITATSLVGTRILLTNHVIGPVGNAAILQSIANSSSLSPVGMSGGSLHAVSGDRALILRSTAFGANARLRLTLRLPTAPSIGTIAVTHSNDFLNGTSRQNIISVLPSGSLIAGSLYSLGTYSVTITPAGNLYSMVFEAVGLNPTSQYQPGNVLNVGGTGVLSGSYMIVGADPGYVKVLAPGNGGLSGTNVLNATQNPVSSFPLSPVTFVDMANAINAYLPTNPIATGSAIGTGLPTNPITLPTYMAYTSATPFVGSTMSLALIYHGFDCKLSGSAGIWLYDSSVPTLNNIKATIQTDDSIFPTTTDAAGTTYSPINEEVVIVPSNSKTLMSWMNFNAASSLTILAETLRIGSGNEIQISSRSDGSLGAVRVTGVTGNAIQSFVNGNATNDEFSTKIKVLASDAQSFMRGHMVKVQNSATSEILRPYRSSPSGNSITPYNTTNTNTFFRDTTSVKYIRTTTNTARMILYRFGQGPGQIEKLTTGDSITLLNIGGGIVQVVSAGGDLASRVGDMMYVKPSASFPADVRCSGLNTNGFTDSDKPEYWGYPVINVIDAKTIQIIAPNITSFGATLIGSSTDLVFIPAIYNEKNIRTNKQEGSKFGTEINGGNLTYLVKALGGNMVSLWLQNSAAEATDTMLLSEMLVNTDDYITIGKGFDSANQGTFKVVAHNGRNHVIFYNPNGGKDELFDSTSAFDGGHGSRKWSVGPVKDSLVRSVRITDAESIKLGDRLRISTPVTTSQWFPAEMIGSWRIIGLGYIGITQATGTLIPVAANPATGIKDADSFVLSDGARTLVFEFDTNGSLTNASHVGIVINPLDNAGAVGNAIVAAINGLSASFSITATLDGFGVIHLLNRNLSLTSNVTITEVFANLGVTLTPVGMAGAMVDNGQLTQYIDVEIPNAPAEIFSQLTALPVDKFVIAGNDSAIGFVESTPFFGFRLVGGHAVNAQDAAISDLFLQPRLFTSKMSDTFGTSITALYKIGFEQRTFQGIDGYKVFAGLVREAHRTIDGLPTNTILYPGVKAMGAPVEVLPPLVKTIQLAMAVRPKDGVTINSISEIIKSTVASYVNRLGVGQPVIIAEIVRIVQGLPGVYSVTVTATTPVVTDDRIVVSDIEKAFVLNTATDITVG